MSESNNLSEMRTVSDKMVDENSETRGAASGPVPPDSTQERPVCSLDEQDAWDAQQEEARVAEAGRVMFELLRGAGFDNVNVCYEACYGEVDITGMAFLKGGVPVKDRDLENQVRYEVESYLEAALPDWHESGSRGRVELYPKSRYAAFCIIEMSEPLWFSHGVPGPDVPDDAR